MQWHQLDHMQTICTSLQTANHTNTTSINFYRPDALPYEQSTMSKHWRYYGPLTTAKQTAFYFINKCKQLNKISIQPSDSRSRHSLHALVRNSLLNAFVSILRHNVPQIIIDSRPLHFISHTSEWITSQPKNSRKQWNSQVKLHTTSSELHDGKCAGPTVTANTQLLLWSSGHVIKMPKPREKCMCVLFMNTTNNVYRLL